MGYNKLYKITVEGIDFESSSETIYVVATTIIKAMTKAEDEFHELNPNDVMFILSWEYLADVNGTKERRLVL